MKIQEKNEAIRLRKLGQSYKEIKRKVDVSKATLSLWLRDIQLTPQQLAGLRGR
jgi:transposase-like protein